MKTHVLPRMACVCAMVVVALTHCGCLSMKGPSGWASAWNSKPKPSNSNTREVVTYWGQKKKEPKPVDKEELKNLMSQGTQDSRQSSYETHLKQGNQALRENRLPEARSEYEKVLAIRPDDPDCHHRLAVVADKEGQFGDADDHYEAALKVRPRDPNLLSDMGYSYTLRHDDRRAEQTLNQALAISPSHKGAMGNLAAIYAKQGRYEDTLAMLRRGGSEAEVQRHMAQLFPSRQENPSNSLAQNSPSTSRAPGDTRGKSIEEVRAMMDQERLQSQRERAHRDELENQRPKIDWAEDPNQRQAGQQPNNNPQSNQPYVLGPGSNQPSLPIVTPRSDNLPSGLANNSQGQGILPGQYGSNGTANAPVDRQFRAPAGTTPSIDEWNGAPGAGNRTIDQAAGADNPFNRRSVSNAHQQQFPSQFNATNSTNQQPNLSQSNPRPGEGAVNGQSASMAAAQIGMNVGPGGLFPITADSASSAPSFSNLPSTRSSPSGFNSNFNSMDSRQPHEFSAPPVQQYPSGQVQPNRGSSGFGDPRQSSTSPARESFSNDTGSLAPPSPGSNFSQPNSNWSQPSTNFSQPTSSWSQPGNSTQPGNSSQPGNWSPPANLSQSGNWSPPGNSSQQASNPPVSQAGGGIPSSGPSQPRIGTDPLERFPSPAESGWAEKPNLNGAAPFNGSWPQNSQQPIPNPGNVADVNSLPLWNGGQGDNRPQPKQIGTATAGYPDQWPHSQPR